MKPEYGAPRGKYLAGLCMGALGIVYGDIGTSPLYALRECFHGPHAIEVTRANVLGVVSLILWSLVLVISVKYTGLVLRADNDGEGGILSLVALIRTPRRAGRRSLFMIGLGLFGAALLYGDGIITPAISVLSAVEGLDVATPFFRPFVVPLTIAILVALFFFQSKGTGRVGAVFGPLTVAWFVTLAGLGIYRIAGAPEVLAALNPAHAVRFFAINGVTGFLVLGTVFLAVTGGEALYADMGHFGRRPIRLAWFTIVLPALALNYWGQGALLLLDPGAAVNPFYRTAPAWALYPLVVLATCATSIASQAVISGAFSLTRQAIQLGYSPRMRIEHTSAQQIGQIYVPGVNWALMVCCISLVLGFKSSSALAAAYGIAVTATMVITTVLLTIVAREIWGWRLRVTLPLMGLFLAIDLAFFGANIVKVAHGGWFPLVAAGVVFTLMVTWKRGRRLLTERLAAGTLPLDLFLKSVAQSPPLRVPGTAVFMDRVPEGVPPSLLHNVKHNKILHERVVLLTVAFEEVPHVAERLVQVEDVGQGLHRVTLRYGYMEDPDIPAALDRLTVGGKGFNLMDTTFFLGRESLLATERPGLPLWQEELFAWMTRNAERATTFFRIPPGRVVELGMQVEL